MKIGKKGIIESLIGLVIIGIGLIMAVVVPFFYLHIHIVDLIQFDGKYNNADLSLLTLLSLKNDGKPIPQILAEHYVLNNPSDISFVNSTLKKIIPDRCFLFSINPQNISVPAYSLIIKSDIKAECSPDTASQTKLILPYNPKKLTETLELSVS